MSKPKIVCVVGSAVLAPLAFLVPTVAIGLAIFVVFGPLDTPSWVRWIVWGLGLALAPMTLWSIYKWFFGKCYSHSAGDVGGK